MTDPNNGAPAPQYPASNGTPDANNPAEPNTAAPQYGAPAPAYGQLSGNPYGQPAYGQEQPTQPNPAYSQPHGQPAGAQSAPAYGQPAYGQPNGNPYGQPDGAYGQVPPTYNAYPASAAATDTNAVPLNKPYYGCSFQEAFLRFWKKYVVFRGRASRSEFWWWMLASFAIQVVLSTLVDASNDHLSFLSSLWSLAILVPSIALSVRRLHDINKPGWWLAIFYGAVFAGAILMIVGGGAALFGALRVWGSPSDSGYYATAAAGSLGILFIGAIIAAAAGIVYIVFMTLPSKPEGARLTTISSQPSLMALRFPPLALRTATLRPRRAMATRMPRLTGRPHRPHRLIIRMPSRLLSLYRAATRTRSRLHRPHLPLTVSRLPLRPTTVSPRHLPPTRSPLPHKPLTMVSRRLPLLTTGSPPRQLLPPSRLSHRMIQPSRLPTTRTTARIRGKVSDITIRQPGQTGLPTEKTAPPIVRLEKYRYHD